MQEVIERGLDWTQQQIGPGAEVLDLLPTTASRFPEDFAQLSREVGPSYLPAASYADGWLAVHLLPGRSLESAPWVLVQRGYREALFLASCASALPAVAPLRFWIEPEDDEAAVLRAWAASLDRSDRLQAAYEAAAAGSGWPTYWTLENSAPWVAADPGNDLAAATAAFEPLNEFLSSVPATPIVEEVLRTSRAPELLATSLAVDLKEGRPGAVELAAEVLRAECWRNPMAAGGSWMHSLSCPLEGWGIAALALGNAGEADVPRPLRPIHAYPELFVEATTRGVDTLLEVARSYEAAGELDEALNVARNAAHLSVHVVEVPSDEACEAVARIASSLEPGGLAAAIANAARNLGEP